MRQRLNRNDRRDRILRAAVKVFGERGYHGAQMEHIRAAADLSRGGLYHHFEAKDAILAAIVDADCAEMARSVADAPRKIAALLETGSEMLGTGAAWFDTACLEGPQEKDLFLAALEVSQDRWLKPLVQEDVRVGIAEGRYRSVSPGHVAELFLLVNARLNRCALYADQAETDPAGFASTALEALGLLLGAPDEFAALAERLSGAATGKASVQ